MKIGRLKSAAFDLGVGIHDNFTKFRLSLIFIDVLINTQERFYAIAFGMPFLFAFTIYSGNKTKQTSSRESTLSDLQAQYSMVTGDKCVDEQGNFTDNYVNHPQSELLNNRAGYESMMGIVAPNPTDDEAVNAAKK